MSAALRTAGYAVDGPSGRDRVPTGEAILLCVPDRAIASACEAVCSGHPAFVGHTSGSATLAPLVRAREAGAEVFSMHPLQSFTGTVEVVLAGVGCAVAGSSPRAEFVARTLAEALGMTCFCVCEERRAAYHAAASVASNFLVTLEATAELLASHAGIDPAQARRLLAPLVRSTVDNWQTLGPRQALTGPVARGDRATVACQRQAVVEADPSLCVLFDALVERTEALAGSQDGVSAESSGKR